MHPKSEKVCGVTHFSFSCWKSLIQKVLKDIIFKALTFIYQLLLRHPLLPGKMLSSTAMSKQSDGVSQCSHRIRANVKFPQFFFQGSARACVYPGSKHGREEALCPRRFHSYQSENPLLQFELTGLSYISMGGQYQDYTDTCP